MKRIAAILALAALSGCAAIPEPPIAPSSPEDVIARPICFDGKFVGMIVAVKRRGVAEITWAEDPCAGGT